VFYQYQPIRSIRGQSGRDRSEETMLATLAATSNRRRSGVAHIQAIVSYHIDLIYIFNFHHYADIERSP
jgi:hypothetical protein